MNIVQKNSVVYNLAKESYLMCPVEVWYFTTQWNGRRNSDLFYNLNDTENEFNFVL